jgi:predicted DNA-binding protein
MSCYDHNRVRSKTIAFRITPELNEQINLIVAASGMTKQDYITSKLLDLEVTIVPSTYTYAALRDEMREVDWQPFSGHFFQRLRPAFLNSTGLM